MNKSEVIDQFRHLVAEFKEDQKLFILALTNRDFEAPVFEAIHKVATEIKERLAHHDVLQIDDLSLRYDLIAIRGLEGQVLQ